MALQLLNICKSYGVDVVLENVNMNIGDNEKVGLIGVNGAGKTTLLKIISGELSYDSGSIFTPKDATIEAITKVVLSPTPPVECLSTVIP